MNSSAASAELFLQHEGIAAVAVVARQSLYDAVPMVLVEGQGAEIVGRGLENDVGTSGSLNTLFGCMQEPGASARAACDGQNVDGDDVSGAATRGFRDHEANDSGREIFVRRRDDFSDQGEGRSASHVGTQLNARVGDAGSKTLLVDLPKSVEIETAGLA